MAEQFLMGFAHPLHAVAQLRVGECGGGRMAVDRARALQPDVVLMAYRPERVGAQYIPGEGSYCDDWDTAAEKQQRAVREWNTQ